MGNMGLSGNKKYKWERLIVSKSVHRWKIENPIETWLSYLADSSLFWKKIYVLYYKIFASAYYEKGLSLIYDEIEKQRPNIEDYNESERKLMIIDMIYSLHRFGVSYEEYFGYKYYNLNTRGRWQFNNLKMQYGLSDLLNEESIRPLFENKGECYRLFRDFYKRDLIVVFRDNPNTEEISSFIQKHSSFVLKPLCGHSGQGIKLCCDFNDYSEKGITVFLEQHRYDFVLEELIIQAEPMRALHPSSINTLRIVTFKQEDEVVLLGGALRMGIGGSFVDNAGKGGIYASLDIETGIVNSMAIDNLGNYYVKHPSSGIVIPGFMIPKWEELCGMITEIASVLPGAVMISWDMAFTEEGWCMVEGNDVGGHHLIQMPTQKGIKNKLDLEIRKRLGKNDTIQ